jgi:hypothetical protein
MLGGLLTFKQISYFKIAEGGWFFNGLTLQREPRTPDPTLTDLDLILDAGRPMIDKRYNVAENFGYYQKSLVGSDFFFESPTTLRISCLLDNPEYNTENAGTLVYDVGGPYVSPEVWEIGVFDQDNVMVLYGTFPKETKDASKQVENICRLVF